MKKVILIFVFLNTLIVFSQTPINDPHWQLIWEDQFNFLDNNSWVVKNNFDHYSAENGGFGELQVYTNRPENVFIQNGILHLIARKETYSCPQWALNNWGCSRQANIGQPYQYTSGMIELNKTNNIVKYGYIEAKIKCPIAPGFWPAFWLYTESGNNGIGTERQEIDIFEMVPGRLENCVYLSSQQYFHNQFTSTSNLHYSLNSNDPFCTSNFRVLSVNDYTSWHTYGLDWSPSKISFYIDGDMVRVEDNLGMHDPTAIIINFALNPQLPLLSSSSFPAEVLVDYVKNYRLKACNGSVNNCHYDFSTHTNDVKNSFVIGGTNCQTIVPNIQPYFIRAGDIVINGDFEVPLGSEIYFESNACY
ncbi:MAG TPA: glycoside hydrolase family 16 protein [Fluviicola sp.]|nr:glycoside hydrolase family 16 protein [Fluviicola sp.]